MTLYVATSCVADAADAAEALDLLERWGVERAQLVPGRVPGPRWEQQAARWHERLLLHDACLEPPGRPPWNLASMDADLRERSIRQAADTLRRAADLGASHYSLRAGVALELGLDAAGRPVGPPQPRRRALERLAGALDRLAAVADGAGLALLVKNAAGRREATGRAARELDPTTLPLLQEPDEIALTFERVAAPMLGLQLDVHALLLACQARRWEPEPVLEMLQPWVRAIALSESGGGLPRPDSTVVALARQAGGGALPMTLAAREVPRAELLAILRELV